MTMIDTLNYFISEMEGDLKGIEWDIREESNYEPGLYDWYSDQYNECKQRLDDLQQIKSIIEAQQ